MEDNMLWKNWLMYFEGWCTESKIDNSWKIQNIQRFLKRKTLTLYVNSSLKIIHWQELVELFNEEFTTPGEISYSDFSEIRFFKRTIRRILNKNEIDFACNYFDDDIVFTQSEEEYFQHSQKLFDFCA